MESCDEEDSCTESYKTSIAGVDLARGLVHNYWINLYNGKALIDKCRLNITVHNIEDKMF